MLVSAELRIIDLTCTRVFTCRHTFCAGYLYTLLSCVRMNNIIIISMSCRKTLGSLTVLRFLCVSLSYMCMHVVLL